MDAHNRGRGGSNGAVEGRMPVFADLHHFTLICDPHQSERLDPDPYQNERPDLDPHQWGSA